MSGENIFNKTPESAGALTVEQKIDTEILSRLKDDLFDSIEMFEKLDTEKSLFLYQGFEDKQEALEHQLSSVKDKFEKLVVFLLDTTENTDGLGILDVCVHNLVCAIRGVKNISMHFDFAPLDEIRGRIIADLPKFEPILREETSHLAMMDVFSLATLMAKSNNVTEKKTVCDFAVENLSVVEKLINFDPSFATRTPVVDILSVPLKFGSVEDTELALELIERLLNNEFISESSLELLAGLFYSKPKQGKDYYDDVRALPVSVIAKLKWLHKNILEKAGISSDVATSLTIKWTQENEARVMFIAKNTKSVIRLEKVCPGIVENLYKKYGITEFGRYPDEMLVKQYENMDNEEDPYGIVIFPKDDWNGAFHMNVAVFRDLMGDMEKNPDLEKYLIRIFECGTKMDVAKAFLKLDQQFGEKHKISFAIVGGHGSRTSINLGNIKNGYSRSHLFSDDLDGSGARRLKDFFEPNATIILSSCSTGQKEGIAQTLSEKFGLRVVAPTIDTSLSGIEPTFEKGGIVFNVTYRRQDIGQNEKAEAVFEPK